MSNKLSLISLLIATLLFFPACDPDNPIPPVVPEVITTLHYTLTPMGGGPSVVLSFEDLDGDGGNPPIVSDGILATNQIYTGAIELLNESLATPENITEEVEAEDDEHQFFFQSTIPNLSVTYSDQDANGNPVGLSTVVSTGDIATGDLTIILRHKPEKFASGVSGGDITNANGETDIQVTFPISVQ